jgi:hypothetical protein
MVTSCPAFSSMSAPPRSLHEHFEKLNALKKNCRKKSACSFFLAHFIHQLTSRGTSKNN